jgi:hypothetical protein
LDTETSTTESGNGNEVESGNAVSSRPNWFQDEAVEPTSPVSPADATFLAALRKVRQVDANSSILEDTDEARLKKRAAQLAGRDRDYDDLDLGFGASRFDDAEDMDGDGVKFSKWKGMGGGDEADEVGQGARAGAKRKRGPKKKKGDKNSATDVLHAMERQKKTKMLG